MAKIEEVIAGEASALMDKFPEGIIAGVGQTKVDGRECIYVMLEQDLPEIRASIPSTLGGYPVVIEFTGPIPIQTDRLEGHTP